MNTFKSLFVTSIALAVLGASAVRAATTNAIGTYNSWPSSWKALSGVNDPIDTGISAENDIVGDASNPAGFYASDSNYVYFRMQVYTPTYSTTIFQDAHYVMIDIVGAQLNQAAKTLNTAADDHLPDYAFAWDSKSNDSTAHGLEMVTRRDSWTQGTLWNVSCSNRTFRFCSSKPSGRAVNLPEG